ncbi:MAG: pyridine nucleotide-disulfide oxidoreductase [Thermodesulfobacteriota bacterium]
MGKSSANAIAAEGVLAPAGQRHQDPSSRSGAGGSAEGRPGPAEVGQAARSAPAPYCDLHAAPVTSRSTLFWYAITAAALFFGWRLSYNEYLVAEDGSGYYLGIVGGSLMLLLLVYPLRKKARLMRNWGPVKHWFRAHMVLGVVGPVLVIFHANFRFGSLNSTVALVSTLLVAGSGFVGRHFHAKVHYGLYGRKMSLAEIKKDLEAKENSLHRVLGFAPRLQARLLALDAFVLKTPTGFMKSFLRYVVAGPFASWTHLMIRMGLARTIDVAARRYGWSGQDRARIEKAARAHVSNHVSNALMIAEFSVYERLLALWHLFHFPLFLMLVVVGIVHVVAVHMY